MAQLRDKHIVLGVTGCIAAYKAAELVRQIVKEGGRVYPIMTAAAQQFITPLTLQTLSGNPVATDLFVLQQESRIGHISLAQRADLLVVAPATANCIGKVAAGIADDLLTTVVLATRSPVLFAPAMNQGMWENPVLQRNLATLRELGYHIIEPGWGDLACGEQGKGRLADIEDIMDTIITLLSPHDFEGVSALVTAGPTREHMDPVRFISNPSTGKMGFAIARCLKRRGARVTLVSGPSDLRPPAGVTVIPVRTAQEMAAAVERHFETAHLIIKSAAVSDYRPKVVATDKMKKKNGLKVVEFETTTDILAGLGARKGNRILVGFAAETADLLENAREKLRSKNLDMIVVNDVGRRDIGFGSDINKVTIIMADGTCIDVPALPKDEVAGVILDHVAYIMHKRTAIPDEPA
ncbi:MAG: bifunctional phosphopantothenoylcysteine decarboxylase/phosphopantothenate--cysteine ligase CoaBC [Desulfobacterota bacterium]|nr:bifunctional phosphopantothenoylcysteine decarboxylase/phosphopantothenate--cysteine ligase CoaBC [Thermodesulfobacteriota bacterium]